MLGVEQFTTKQDLHGKIIGCDIRYVLHELECDIRTYTEYEMVLNETRRNI